MRIVTALVVALGLAGCAQPQVHAPVPPSPLGTADPRFIPAARSPDELAARRRNEDAAGLRLAQAERDAQAEALCGARAEMAGATFAGRGFGLPGAVSAGAEAGVAAERVRASCLDVYRRTGILPSF